MPLICFGYEPETTSAPESVFLLFTRYTNLCCNFDFVFAGTAAVIAAAASKDY
jgi:hypothetical protein